MSHWQIHLPQPPSPLTRKLTITKELFASGLQCAKRLYLDVHHPDRAAPMSLRRQALAQIGRDLTELARAAFPRSERADGDDLAKAVKQTRQWLEGSPNLAIFDAGFATDGLETRVDIAIADGAGHVDVYEVKSGTKVKRRHVLDLAFQVHVIEACGFEVRNAWILHVNTRYKYRGGNNHPVHELFKNVDVTKKVKGQQEHVARLIAGFRTTIADETVEELPTGTWCQQPFPCDYLQACRASAPDHPLLDLPELTREQEVAFHEEAIEELGAIDLEREGLTLVQRRALRAMRDGEAIIEPFVGTELRDVECPLFVVDAIALLQVVPAFEKAHPWHHVPFAWSVLEIDEDGTSSVTNHVEDGKEDPRTSFVQSLDDTCREAGTIMLWGTTLEQRLRDLLEDLSEGKSAVRAFLGHPRCDLRQLVRVGAYAPSFRGSFSLEGVHAALVGGRRAKLEINDDDEAQAACERLANSRTRAKTREKLCQDLEAYCEARARMIADVYLHLLEATQDVPV